MKHLKNTTAMAVVISTIAFGTESQAAGVTVSAVNMASPAAIKAATGGYTASTVIAKPLTSTSKPIAVSAVNIASPAAIKAATTPNTALANAYNAPASTVKAATTTNAALADAYNASPATVKAATTPNTALANAYNAPAATKLAQNTAAVVQTALIPAGKSYAYYGDGSSTPSVPNPYASLTDLPASSDQTFSNPSFANGLTNLNFNQLSQANATPKNAITVDPTNPPKTVTPVKTTTTSSASSIGAQLGGAANGTNSTLAGPGGSAGIHRPIVAVHRR